MLKTQRLHNQHITSLHDGNPATLLSYMGAIQGQDPVGAKWSLGLRLPHNTEAHIEQAIDKQSIVRTWLMRGTLFMIAARDLRWLLALVAPRVIQQSQRRYKQLELDETTLAQANEILARAVEDHHRIGRRDLYAILEQHGISTDGQRGFYIVRHASLRGHIVHGHVEGNDPVFTYFDDPADTLAPMPREEALAKLA
ncbi:MAG: crosslink repair DNA glycosylase YcaQ family protein, partial [Chloroflexota bacterium]